MPIDRENLDLSEQTEIIRICKELKESKLQVSILSKGLDNPEGFIYAGTYRTLSKFQKLKIIEFSDKMSLGKHIGKLTSRGRSVLKLLAKNGTGNVKAVKTLPAIPSIAGKGSRRSSSSCVNPTPGIQHKEADAKPD